MDESESAPGKRKNDTQSAPSRRGACSVTSAVGDILRKGHFANVLNLLFILRLGVYIQFDSNNFQNNKLES